MKLMKAMKQLKLWSRKKKRKKTEHEYYKLTHDQLTCAYNPPPPPPRAPPPRQVQPPPVCECHFCGPLEPSAPPLPPWLEATNATYSGHRYNEVDSFSSMSPTHQEQSQDLKFEIVKDSIPTEESCLSHQNSWTDPFWGVDQPCSGEDHCINLSQEETPNNWTDPFWSVDQPGSSDDHCISISQEEMPDASLLSNQQLMSQNVECGQLVQYNRQKGGTGNIFACFMDVGGLLLRCFIPCFRNSEQLALQNSSISRRVVPDEDERKKIV